MNSYDFVIDTDILDDLQTKVDEEKEKTKQAINDIFEAVDNMNVNKFWEGKGYAAFSEAINEKKSNLDDLSASLDDYSIMLSNTISSASNLVSDVKKFCKSEGVDN